MINTSVVQACELRVSTRVQGSAWQICRLSLADIYSKQAVIALIWHTTKTYAIQGSGALERRCSAVVASRTLESRPIRDVRLVFPSKTLPLIIGVFSDRTLKS